MVQGTEEEFPPLSVCFSQSLYNNIQYNAVIYGSLVSQGNDGQSPCDNAIEH